MKIYPTLQCRHVELGARWEHSWGYLRNSDTGAYYERNPILLSCDVRLQLALLSPMSARVAKRVQSIQSLRRNP